MKTLGLFIPQTYPAGERAHLTRTIEASLYDPPKHDFGIVKMRDLAHGAKLDTLIVAQDLNFENLYATTDAQTFQDLAALKDRNPHVKIAFYYTGRHAADAEVVRALPSFHAAAQNEAVDLVFANIPLALTFNAMANKNRSLGRHIRPDRDFKRVLGALDENRFEGRIISPQLADTSPRGDSITLGDLTIDREKETVTLDGETLDLAPRIVAMLGTYAAYQNSWVPAPLMMSRVYTPAELAQGRDPKTIDVYAHKLGRVFDDIGLGALHNIRCTGRFVRARDFKATPSAP